MSQVGTGKADGALLTLKRDPGVRAKILAALAALRPPMRNEYPDLIHPQRHPTKGTRTVPGTRGGVTH